jgi:predicted phosphodiesterase
VLELDAASPLLVFGGPYSNVRATEAIRREAERLAIPPDRVICTGDVVAYCAEPEETTELMRDWGCHVIKGNCEEKLAEGAEDCGCNFAAGSACDLLARGWYPFAAARISEASRAWMAALPATIRFRMGGRHFRVIHGGVTETARWVFASDAPTLEAEQEAAQADVVIAGHAGVPFIASTGRGTWFNPGVIGMPANDGTPDGWYGLIHAEREALRLSTHRLVFDSRAAAAAVRRYRYADSYARALVTGLWPSLDVLPSAEQGATGQRLKARSLLIRRAPLAAQGGLAA